MRPTLKPRTTPLVMKADGELEPFSEEKLLSSLERAGAEVSAAEHIATLIRRDLRDGMTTHEIYRRAFAHLREHKKSAAARYSLKRAVQDLGPSGFPFEAYLAELFRTEAWEVKLNQIVRGSCVEHEIDVLLSRKQERVYVEAKFHNSPGFKTDLKVALYVAARTVDIAAGPEKKFSVVRGMVVTNTKFTSLAVAYAKCNNLELLAWDEPYGNSLHDRIERAGLYPITALTTLSKAQKTALLNERVVLCRHLSRQEDSLSRSGVKKSTMQHVLEEAGNLCGRH